MSKSNKKKNSPKKKARNSKAVVVNKAPQAEKQLALINRGVATKIAKQICSISNPFCDEARGARWPDNSYRRSIASTNRLLYSISTDSTGHGGAMFLPYLDAEIAPGTFGSPAPNVLNFSSLIKLSSTGIGTVGNWRITSWGIRLKCTVSRFDASGTVFVQLYSGVKSSFYSAVTLGECTSDRTIAIPLARLVDRDEFIIPMPSGTNARLFNRYGGYTTIAALAAESMNWQVVIVGISGAPADATPLLCDLVYNYEYVPVEGDATYFLAASPPPDNQIAQDGNAGVLNKIGNFFEGSATALDNVFQSTAFKLGASAIGGYLGGTTGASSAYRGVSAMQASRSIIDVD